MAEKESKKEKSRISKIAKLVFFVVFIFFISGISSVIFDKYVFPWLASSKWCGKQAFFKQAMDNVTVINKTEQITVNESQDVSGYTQKSASSIVEIVVRSGENENSSLPVQSSVSGIIVTSDGLVASYGDKFFENEGAEYKVFSQDGKSFNAKVATLDSFSNIALLKLDGAENLPVAEFIAPEDIRTGIKTVAISRSGYNSEISLRLGIASEWAKSYSVAGPVPSSEKLQGVLLADFQSAENTGNKALAGGAAVDQNGNVIGILGERRDGTIEKLFIVPVNHLSYVVDQHLKNEKIERAVLGVYYQALSRETSFLAQSGFDRGAMVYSPSGQQGLAVIADGPADMAGIKIGDIILSVNGEEINPDQNLAYLISKYKPGDQENLKINRDGKETELRVVLN